MGKDGGGGGKMEDEESGDVENMTAGRVKEIT